MNYGIVDIGSNTIRLNVYQVDEKGYAVLFSKKYTAGLASYVKEGQLSSDGIEILKRTIKSILEIEKSVKLERLLFFATASLRNVSNNEEIIANIKEELQVAIHLLTQKDEARLGHIGIEEVYGKTDGLSVDIGGGSSEISIFKEEETIGDVSLSIGSLSLFKEYVKEVLPTDEEFDIMRNSVRGMMKNNKDLGNFATLSGIGGTIRAIGRVIHIIEKTNSDTQFTAKQLKSLSKKMIARDKKAIKAIFKTAPERIHTFTPGMAILLEVCKKFDVETILVSHKGIREGYLLDYLKSQS